MNAAGPRRFVYAERTWLPGAQRSYHVHTPAGDYVGRVYLTTSHTWLAGETDPVEYGTRESAAWALLLEPVAVEP